MSPCYLVLIWFVLQYLHPFSFHSDAEFCIGNPDLLWRNCWKERRGLAAKCRDFLAPENAWKSIWNCGEYLRSLFPLKKNIKSNPCWHFKMLSLGFRGNTPEQFTLCKAIIFHCERTKLCQFTPWSSFKAAQKPCCCKAWRRSTALVWAGAAPVAKFTAAGSPLQMVWAQPAAVSQAVDFLPIWVGFEALFRMENSLWYGTELLPWAPTKLWWQSTCLRDRCGRHPGLLLVLPRQH